jgi:acetyl-CoA carboxylase biotin carboxylase subunit
VDTQVLAGWVVPPHSDWLGAKLVVPGSDRDDARARARAALALLRVDGVSTTAPMHAALLQDPEFCAGGVDTGFFERFLAARLPATAEAVS